MTETIRQIDTLIIGSGISGIGAAIRLQNAGMTDFVILEKFSDIGGTWRDNTYPGCECDVPSALYSYSFEPNPAWSRIFAGQKEILGYVQNTVKKHNVRDFIQFNVEVQKGEWNEEETCWWVHTSEGLYKANKVISCVGYLHEPIIPNLPGLNSFKGEVFHSSRWQHDVDLTGKRVAVVGTGASAIQFVPKIQNKVSELHIFQRSPQWILPKTNLRVPKFAQMLLAVKPLYSAFRGMLYSGMELFGIGFRRPAILKQIQRIAKFNINRHIKDPELRKKVTPSYIMGCKRVLLSNEYYPAIAKSNVDVIHSGVKEIRGNTVVGTNGEEREVDVIILGTGFYVSDLPVADKITGASGKTLADIWQGSPEAYRGTTCTDFPNCFVILGPNLAIGHNSAFIVIEAQLNYVMGALEEMRNNEIDRLEVSASIQKAYNEKVQHDLQKTVWNTGGCTSYYLDANGKNSIGFPWSTLKMKQLLNHFDSQAYRLTKSSHTNN
ncbi:cyclohexanone monooxygenase [Veronia nyctiphanis]|uniref:Cyclohexanone monooxygenase n=1 Tax=Veronia nyctiphanis TaxID=1278244 RepID=A0A4Q0YRH5_9GAMM|nr:NAD(P)/FAD-dependent oxidoreductase [Veronia nyctiphanis]RXJ73716.1 cyclohexanone monooxygenase [Veronia nyctiphanis]